MSSDVFVFYVWYLISPIRQSMKKGGSTVMWYLYLQEFDSFINYFSNLSLETVNDKPLTCL